ncbi:MAG TPA: DUF4296 domain-containing protein [Chitinophagaceae bacterium]|nr:DUF4296 domain-containing protein [Chitinophagaceae bacterium]
MRRWIACVIVTSFLISCSSGDDIPRDVIPINDMKVIMYDVMCAQELAAVTNPKDTVAARDRTFELYQQVFAIHKITKDDFFKSFHYYEANPDKISILYDSISAYADRKKREMYMRIR